MNAKIAIRLFCLMTVLTGLIYPLLVTVIGQLLFSHQANGSLVYNGDRVIGSSLIAQKMTQNGSFWPRPSNSDYQPIPSGGSNEGPTSLKLKGIVAERLKVLQHPETTPVPSELVYSSGSALDPHISLQAAYFQIDRIAKARSVPAGELQDLVNQIAKRHRPRFVHPHYVNVLLLNQALQQKYGQ